MQNIQNVFDNQIGLYKCDHADYFTNNQFLEALHSSLTLSMHVKNRDVPAQSSGKISTTLGIDWCCPYMFPGAKDLKSWVFSQVDGYLQCCLDVTSPQIEIYKCWTNCMYQDSNVTTHHHHDRAKFHIQKGWGCITTIFYVDTEMHTGDLVFVNTEIQNQFVAEHEKEQVYRIKPVPGLLVIHDTDIMHGVDVYAGTTPRISIIADIRYSLKDADTQ